MKTSLIDTIKEKITIPDYLAREHGIKPMHGRAKSFRQGAKNPSSLMVNERDFYDFGSGIGGDIIDLAAHDKFSGDKGQAIRYLAEAWGLKEISVIPEIDIVFRSYEKIIDLASIFYSTQLQQNHINYLHGRGLTDETIKALRIGWAGNPCAYIKEQGFTQEQIAESGILSFVNRLVIPYMRNGKAVYMIGRASAWEDQPSANPDAKYMKLYRNEMSEHPIWGFDTIRKDGPVIIAEGIFDAISAWQEKYAVVTAVTGAFSAEQKKDLFPALKGREVVICMDYDPETKAGQKFTETLANELFEAGIHVSCVLLEGKDKKVDMSDLYACNPERETLEKLFANAKRWESIVVERIGAIKNKNESRAKLTTFLRRCSLNLDAPALAQFIEEIRLTGKFDEIWLKELHKILKAAPPDDTIVRDFCKKYDCVFHEALGWYEYNETVWIKALETEIKSRVAKLFGRYRTNNRVSSVYQLLKAELIYKGSFDAEQDLINFPNGMLNIQSGKLMPHSRDYYSTIQLDYPYDEKAECPAWMTFIKQITADDDKRENLLQEMFGYCFTKDARYQKCFFLIGDGANGKSVLLSVLKALVSPTNTSHVEISSLESAFERICLYNKLVNIASETKSDVHGTEAIFKQIVAGDPISGCYKGKDFINFTPFCKIIFAANEQIQARDLSYGFLRRICFIRFPVRFVEIPNNPDEREKDPNLTPKLLTELPGIFNWAYRGLKELRANNFFTLTGDQTTLTREFIVMSNPLVSFVEDVLSAESTWIGQCSRQAVYKAYNDWCRKTNTCPMSARTFWPRLRLAISMEEQKSNGSYTVRFDFSKKPS